MLGDRLVRCLLREFGMLEMNEFGTFRSPSDQDERDSLRMLKFPPKKTL